MKIKSRTELKVIILYGFIMFLHIIVYKTRDLTPHPSGFACHLPLGGEGLEAACIAALTAEFFDSASVIKAFEDIFCSFGVQNFGERCFMDVTEGYFALSVEAAGYHSAVGEYAKVVAKSVTKHR